MLGTIGKSAGVTTPKVLEKSDIKAAIAHIINGIKITLISFSTRSENNFITPASTAMLINIPTPQIIIKVPQGIKATTCFSSANFKNKAMATKIMAIMAISIFLLK